MLIPNDLASFSEERSSFALVGTRVHLIVPRIHQGSDETIALEIANSAEHRRNHEPGRISPTAHPDADQRALEGIGLHREDEKDALRYQDAPIPRKDKE